jgi:SAM-dependent methyltransferase
MRIGFRRRRRPKPIVTAEQAALSPEVVARSLYRGMLGREAEPAGLDEIAGQLRRGVPLDCVVDGFISSPEFRARMIRSLAPAVELPDLTQLMPERYELSMGPGSPTLYVAQTNADISLMEGLIRKHRFYDRFGVWSPVIDLDKMITAAIVRGLGARSCFELGCFTGPVLSLLAEAGMAVAGLEISHSAFAFAYPNIRDAIIFGDLLNAEIDQRFDVVLCMDVLEHLNPLRLDEYIARIGSILQDGGYIYLNSPMWGFDQVFGTAGEQNLQAWKSIGDASYWRHWPCDDRGWPEHGHLVWASPNWWTAKFAAHGLDREPAIEQVIQHRLATFFELAPGRRSLFVLRHREKRASSASTAAAVDAALAAVPGLT